MKASRLSVASFKELKAALEKKREAEAGNPTPARTYQKKSRKTTQKTEEELFREAMSGVREIAEFREIRPKKPPRFKPPPAGEEIGVEALREIVDGRRKITLADTDEYVEWVRPGIRRDVAGRLHGGEFSVQDYIDLHGLTEEEAEGECAAFIRMSVRKRLFCVKVIHGRGLRSPKGPVLKQALQQWLRGPLRKYVLAYATARDFDGGLGATYVLLKHI